MHQPSPPKPPLNGLLPGGSRKDSLNRKCCEDCAGLLDFLGNEPLRDSIPETFQDTYQTSRMDRSVGGVKHFDLAQAGLPGSINDDAEPP